MPNSRRRRFSVQNGIKDSSKIQNNTRDRHNDDKSDAKMSHQLPTTKSTFKTSAYANSSPMLEIAAESSSSISIQTVLNMTAQTLDKYVTASSSIIDLCIDSEGVSVNNSRRNITIENGLKKGSSNNRDQIQARIDKHPRLHRVKVRSPKRRPVVPQNKAVDTERRTIGTSTADWPLELDVSITDTDLVPTFTESLEDESDKSTHSIEDMCRICHSGERLTELGTLISACSCRGTIGKVHVKCLERWLTESGKSRCELCGIRYATRRVHRYGVPRALVMWMLSHNAKQLMVDSLGIMLMSPLAVLAAWLSGRTLAGLMKQDNHVTPWPLASTFVLACMTLVCYYCWIVSAATRHALGWWIWYRSQYEVRLQLNDSDQ